MAGDLCTTYGDHMASDPQLELRVTRLENDRDSIYELLTEIKSTQTEHSERFDAIEQRFEGRLDGIDGRLDGIDQRFDGMDQRFDGIDHRLDGIEQRLVGIDQRFDGIEATLSEVVRRLPQPS